MYDFCFKVQLHDKLVVTGIVTKGRGNSNEYVTKFKIKYTTDCSTDVSYWLYSKDLNGQEVGTLVLELFNPLPKYNTFAANAFVNMEILYQ